MTSSFLHNLNILILKSAYIAGTWLSQPSAQVLLLMGHSVPDDILAQVRERLASLNDIDKKIAQILEHGSNITTALQNGKQGVSSERDAQEKFIQSFTEYNEIIKTVHHELVEEVRLMAEASSSNLLPLGLPTQAPLLEIEQERNLWAVFEGKVDRNGHD